MTFRDVHMTFAWIDIGLNAAAGAWVLAAHWLTGLRRREMWWLTGAAYGAVIIQVILGVILMNVFDLEPNRKHMFYGFVAMASVAIVYSYRSQMEYNKYLLFGFGSLFIMGLGIRAVLLA